MSRLVVCPQALHQFNAARRDPEWGQQAVHNMIEICLDSQQQGQGGLLYAEDSAMEERDARQAALSTAERLLTELRGSQGQGQGHGTPEEDLNKRLLSNQLLLATGEKRNIEKAVQDLTVVVSIETENHREPVGAVLGLANALLLQKQTQRARNQLKRLARTPWTVEQANHLERAWLLLADLYIQQGKQELAADLLRRVLQHNQASLTPFMALLVCIQGGRNFYYYRRCTVCITLFSGYTFLVVYVCISSLETKIILGAAVSLGSIIVVILILHKPNIELLRRLVCIKD